MRLGAVPSHGAEYVTSSPQLSRLRDSPMPATPPDPHARANPAQSAPADERRQTTPTPQTPAAAGALRGIGIASLLALTALSVAWELWLAPLRPGGSWLVLKALLLLLPLRGVLRGSLYTLQWSSMFILLFFAEGVVRGMTDSGTSAALAWIETALCVVFFFSTIFYLRPFKRAAKARAAAARHGAQ
ncbi:membrane protein [Pandoraea nosoerga]|uniref:Membrane protein n=2 Tax=Pandoraea nosoerga TaxID=2508296 RepID=A0A5E4V3V4_9BURK|nr:membrane protein [Pandoraea nosoerga]